MPFSEQRGATGECLSSEASQLTQSPMYRRCKGHDILIGWKIWKIQPSKEETKNADETEVNAGIREMQKKLLKNYAWNDNEKHRRVMEKREN